LTRSSSGRGSTRTGCPRSTYARTRAVGELEVRAGEIVAAVQGVASQAVQGDCKSAHLLGEGVGPDAGDACQPSGPPSGLARWEIAAGVADDLAAAKIDLLPVAASAAALLVP